MSELGTAKVYADNMNSRSAALVRVMIVEDDPGMLERFAAALVLNPLTLPRSWDTAWTGSGIR